MFDYSIKQLKLLKSVWNTNTNIILRRHDDYEPALALSFSTIPHPFIIGMNTRCWFFIDGQNLLRHQPTAEMRLAFARPRLTQFDVSLSASRDSNKCQRGAVDPTAYGG